MSKFKVAQIPFSRAVFKAILLMKIDSHSQGLYSQDLETGCLKVAIVKSLGIQF